MTIVYFFCVVVVGFHLCRQVIAKALLPEPDPIEFASDVFSVGETLFAIRHGGETASKTIVCFPGFTETISYFVDLYKDEDCQLILVNNCLYHLPLAQSTPRKLNWERNPYEQATIEHDAFYFSKIVREFSSGQDIFLHGHSRGAAVVLEAGRQSPEITRGSGKTVTAILEAPVVPQGKSVGVSDSAIASAVTAYLIPIIFKLYSYSSEESLRKSAMMQPTNDLKTRIIMQSFRSPKYYWVCVKNARNIAQWQARHSYALYENFHRIFVLQGERDEILVNTAIEASAMEGQKLNGMLSIQKTCNTNHFISLEQPHYILDILS
jgi:hypothetical protein